MAIYWSFARVANIAVMFNYIVYPEFIVTNIYDNYIRVARLPILTMFATIYRHYNITTEVVGILHGM